ncbi:hypothetical protein HPP92_028129 [Vanilla planifolia]|uniref:Uncharacterized protein n=1 Tax=Vanilla planifolia TaxID=51239 RepID=A0A835U4A3_VANPL|nr:hypothetical protein HPP92_028129 [Vanilla planifolia]KAG0447907.1 hypothetical protein HPP92_028109 [Vanilla planifolia]
MTACQDAAATNNPLGNEPSADELYNADLRQKLLKVQNSNSHLNWETIVLSCMDLLTDGYRGKRNNAPSTS